MTITKQQGDAAQEFSRVTFETLKIEGRVHAETAIAGAARMAGTFLFRSFNFPSDGIKAGQAVTQ